MLTADRKCVTVIILHYSYQFTKQLITCHVNISLHFNGHFPGEPGLAGLLKQRTMEVVVTTGLLEI